MNICPSPDCQRTHTIVSSTNVTIEKIQAIASQGDLSHHCDQLNQLLECAVCCCRFNKATTTACGHTFCHSCLERSMDHLAACPVCRSPVGWIPPPTQLLCNLIVDLFDDVGTSDQLDDIDDNHVPILIGALAFPQVRCFIHIFEPRYRLMLRRVMQSRRRRFAVCLAKRRHENSPGFHEYGTMLELTQVKTLSDGRSIVEAVGSHRFRVVQHSMLDGYHVGELECIDDVDGETEQAREREQILQASASRARGSQQQTLDGSSRTVTRTLAPVRPVVGFGMGGMHRQSWAAQAHPQTQMARSPWLQMHVQGLSAARPKPMQQRPSQTSIPPAATSQTPSPPLAINRQEQTTDDLLNVLASFVNNMRRITMTTTSGSSDRFAQWLQALGEPPSISGPQRNKISFIWWVANMMPLDDQEKVKLLAMRFLRDRVLTLVGYMDRFKDQWSYWLRSNAEGRASGNASTPPSCCIS